MKKIHRLLVESILTEIGHMSTLRDKDDYEYWEDDVDDLAQVKSVEGKISKNGDRYSDEDYINDVYNIDKGLYGDGIAMKRRPMDSCFRNTRAIANTNKEEIASKVYTARQFLRELNEHYYTFNKILRDANGRNAKLKQMFLINLSITKFGDNVDDCKAIISNIGSILHSIMMQCDRICEYANLYNDNNFDEFAETYSNISEMYNDLNKIPYKDFIHKYGYDFHGNVSTGNMCQMPIIDIVKKCNKAINEEGL